MPVMSYRDLIVWQKAMDLVVIVYQLTRAFPNDELYGLTSQVRRAAVSIPSNVAEGQGRGIGGEFAHHLRIANGSRQEMETQILLAQRLGYITQEVARSAITLSEEVGRLLSGLVRSITPD